MLRVIFIFSLVRSHQKQSWIEMLSSSSSGKDESLKLLTSSTVRVDTPKLFANALEDLYSYNRFTFDTEGVNLGRSGDLTIATIQGIQASGDGQKKDEKEEATPHWCSQQNRKTLPTTKSSHSISTRPTFY